MTHSLHKILGSITLFCLFLAALIPPRGVSAQSACELAVLADPGDPYYPLAQEIAESENAPLYHDLSEALDCQPIFLLWVASPEHFSDPAMIAFGQALAARDLATAPGIITGSTMEQARALWQRGAQVQAGLPEAGFYAANAAFPSAHIDQAQLIDFSGNERSIQPLTEQQLIDLLPQAGYLTYTGHGANRYLRLDDDTVVSYDEIPALNGLVISTGSCQTLRPWSDESVARSFVDQGAAAYAGFVFSPNEGYMIGEFNGLPFRYTWPGFTIGQALQVQNRGTLQGFALFPYHFLLGDPRIALGSEPAYTLIDDLEQNGWRILRYSGVPSGVISIRIAGGADYDFVDAPGVTTASASDPFYNSRLQMIDIGADKYLLIEHPGGELTLRLRPRAPLAWRAADLALDSFDHAYVYLQQSGGDMLALLSALVPLAWMVWNVLKKRFVWRWLPPALALGVAAAALHGVYALLRVDQVTINSKAVVISPLGILGTFVLGAFAALMYFHARRPRARVIALLLATFNTWVPMTFSILLVTAFNYLAFKPQMGTILYNNAVGLLSGPAFALTLALSWLALWAVKSRLKRNVGPAKPVSFKM
jgi:hypothetical protein